MQDINNILGKHFAGETTREEEALVSAWKQQYPDEYKALQKSWEEPLDYTNASYDTQEAWKKIESQVDMKSDRGKIVPLRWVWFAAAASVVLLVSILTVNLLGKADFIAVQNDSVSARLIELPDGSKVTLGGGAEIQYARNFEQNRSVKLSGEAYFEVTRDEAHPFIIEAQPGEVEVLGTEFSIDNSSGTAIVSVNHGKVAVRNDKTEVIITDGQTVEASVESVSSVKNNDPNAFSWVSGVFVFEDTPLSVVISVLNSYYAKKIILSDMVAADKKLTARFSNQSQEEIIEVIKLTCNVQATYSSDSIVLE